MIVSCSRGPVPAIASWVKRRPVSRCSRYGSISCPVELPMTVASKCGLRPALAAAVFEVRSPVPAIGRLGKRPVSYGSMNTSSAKNSANPPPNVAQNTTSQRRHAARAPPRGSEAEVDELIGLAAADLHEQRDADRAEGRRNPCDGAQRNSIAQVLRRRQRDGEQQRHADDP